MAKVSRFQKGPGVMPDLKTVFVGRMLEKKLLRKLLSGKMEPVWILNVYGTAGIGKTHLLDQYEKIIGDQYKLVRLDFYHLENRMYSQILRVMKGEMGIEDAGLERLIDEVAGAEKQQLVRVLGEATQLLIEKAVEAAGGKKRYVILVDTFDNVFSVSQAAQWFIPELIAGLKEAVWVVIAGQAILRQKILTPPEKLNLEAEVYAHELKPLIREDALDYINGVGDLKTMPEASKEMFIKASNLEPILLAWLCDMQIRYSVDTKELSYDGTPLIKTLASKMLEGLARPVQRGIKLAAHCYPRFDVDIFKAAVSQADLERFASGWTHKGVMEEVEDYFFVRGRGKSRLLHDLVRDAIVSFVIQGESYDFRDYSRKILEGYYRERIEELRAQEIRPVEEQTRLELLTIESWFHRLVADSEHERREFWLAVNRLRDQLRLDLMALMLDQAKAALERLGDEKSATILMAILKDASAWLYWVQADIGRAKEAAEWVIERRKESKTDVPERILASTKTVYSQILKNEGKIEEALTTAQEAYNVLQGLIDEVRKPDHPVDEFVDTEADMLWAQINIRRFRAEILLYRFIDLNQVEREFIEYYLLVKKQKQQAGTEEWMADALMYRARVKRYRHEINEGLNLAGHALGLILGEPEGEGAILDGQIREPLGLLYKEGGKYALAEQEFQHAAEIYLRNGSAGESHYAEALRGLGEVAVLTHQFEKAWEHYNEAEQIFSGPKGGGIGNKNLEVKMGALARMEGKKEPARKYLTGVHEKSRKNPNPFWEFHADVELAEMEWRDNTEGVFKQLEERMSYYRERGYEFTPLYARAEYILSQIAEHTGQTEVMYEHLVNRLEILARGLKDEFPNALAELRDCFLKESQEDRKKRASQIMNRWVERNLAAVAPELIEMCLIVGRGALDIT